MVNTQEVIRNLELVMDVNIESYPNHITPYLISNIRNPASFDLYPDSSFQLPLLNLHFSLSKDANALLALSRIRNWFHFQQKMQMM